jgi:hypothetical protein
LHLSGNQLDAQLGDTLGDTWLALHKNFSKFDHCHLSPYAVLYFQLFGRCALGCLLRSGYHPSTFAGSGRNVSAA